MKAYLAFFLLLGFFIPDAWAQVSIQNDQKYIGYDGSLHIVGEIQNNLNVPLNQIEVLITLYSNNNEKVGTVSTAPLLNTIMPSMKGPFDLVIGENQAKKVTSYSLDVNYKVTSPKNQVIEITSSDYKRDVLDNFVITGTVANRGEITANTVVVIATLYDRYGNVLTASKTLAEPDYLRANDEMFFFVAIPDNVQADIVDFSLVAESEEYTTVPEFPLGSILLLASSVSAYVLFTRYSSRLITNVVSATNLR